MSCSTMLDQILEADLDVLDGTGDSALARHLRECARCHAIASVMVRDTRALAIAVSSKRASIRIGRAPNRRAANYRTRVMLAGLAAVLSVFAVREWQRRKTVAAESSRVASVQSPLSGSRTFAIPPATVVATRATAPPQHVRPARPQPGAIVTRGASTHIARGAAPVPATVAERTVVKPVDFPVSVAAVRLDTPPDDVSLGAAVAVDPPAGTRANIIRTSNPSVTVVWLYR